MTTFPKRKCTNCGAQYGILADYCGKCGTQLPLKRISMKLQKQKVEHYAIICKGGERHAVQAAFGKKANFCIACGDALPTVK